MPPGNDPAWTVTSQREDWQVGPDGQASHGMTVTFQVTGGGVGSVFVPAADYTTEKVRALVDAKARTVIAVQALKG